MSKPPPQIVGVEGFEGFLTPHTTREQKPKARVSYQQVRRAVQTPHFQQYVGAENEAEACDLLFARFGASDWSSLMLKQDQLEDFFSDYERVRGGPA